MKVPQSIGDIYDDRVQLYERLSHKVGPFIRGHLKKEWHFVDRVKARESYAQKIETGRIDDLANLEDFYACTVVVRDMKEVVDAESIITGLFEVKRRRPKRANFTYSEPSSFDFDHLRLYVVLKEDDALPRTELEGVTFEVQLKTYLQHAWSIATHDLIYKTDEVNWGKARIAYQIKAMLDHAETSISHADQLAGTADLRIENEHIDELRAVIDILKRAWSQDTGRLPEDVKRLAENTLSLIKRIKLTPAELAKDLADEEAEGRGVLVETLSPYGVVLQTLLNRREETMKSLLKDGRVRGRKVVISAEIVVPAGINRDECANAIFL